MLLVVDLEPVEGSGWVGVGHRGLLVRMGVGRSVWKGVERGGGCAGVVWDCSGDWKSPWYVY